MNYDNAFAALVIVWIAGIPVSFGYMVAAGVFPTFTILGSLIWPVVLLGWLGFLIGA